VVTTRSVLIYVADKAAAFAEFRRVLRPGGRISIFEPINTLMQECSARTFYGYDAGPVHEIAAKVSARLAAFQPIGADPMLDFDDRDLVRFAELVGFRDVRLDLEVTVRPTRPALAWDTFLRSAANPNPPRLWVIVDDVLTPAEVTAFSAHLRPLVESGHGTERRAVAYLAAGDVDPP
jgi:arsenite methyltransferase